MSKEPESAFSVARSQDFDRLSLSQLQQCFELCYPRLPSSLWHLVAQYAYNPSVYIVLGNPTPRFPRGALSHYAYDGLRILKWTPLRTSRFTTIARFNAGHPTVIGRSFKIAAAKEKLYVMYQYKLVCIDPFESRHRYRVKELAPSPLRDESIGETPMILPNHPVTKSIFSFAFCADTKGKHLFLSGGIDGAGADIDDLYRYDIAKNEWGKMGFMPQSRYGHQMIVMQDELFVIAGTSEFGMFVHEDVALPLHGDGRWRTIAVRHHVGSRRHGFGIAKVDEDRFAVCAGDDESSTDIYSVSQDRWTLQPCHRIPTPGVNHYPNVRTNFGVVCVRNWHEHLFVIGGNDSGERPVVSIAFNNDGKLGKRWNGDTAAAKIIGQSETAATVL